MPHRLPFPLLGRSGKLNLCFHVSVIVKIATKKFHNYNIVDKLRAYKSTGPEKFDKICPAIFYMYNEIIYTFTTTNAPVE